MKKYPSVFLLVLFSLSAFAGGEHDGGHGHDKAKYSVGEPAGGKPDRIIEVSMKDTMRFDFRPGFEDLYNNEVIRFDVRNDGVIVHEFSIGNAQDQVNHAKMMREMPGMVHKDANTVSLKPGEQASITWRFQGDETVVFSCNVPGHFEAGMGHRLAIKTLGHES